MTPEEEARLRANITLFTDELADLPGFYRMFDLLDLFARILQPEAAKALVALLKIAVDDSDPDDEDDDSDDDEEDGDSDEPGF